MTFGEGVNVLKQLFHVYECQDCVVTFAVEQAYEDHSVICCPICKTDNAIEDVFSGEIKDPCSNTSQNKTTSCKC